jgi:hypothetical protein
VEFLIVFVVSLLLLLLLTVALLFGRSPVYRPSREDAYQMLTTLCEGILDNGQWGLFIGLPIRHDPELEEIRLQCYELELQAEENKDVLFGSGAYRYNAVGMARLELIRLKLKSLIDNTPTYRSF